MKNDFKGCPNNFRALNDTLYILGGKWTIQVLASILAGNDRFREIQRSVPKLSTKVLAAKLKFLEENLLITRTVLVDTPASVTYKPTAYAMTLEKVLEGMIEWGQMHNSKIRSIKSLAMKPESRISQDEEVPSN
jgi:DNA-binding HxlR family transcriptional regulator